MFVVGLTGGIGSGKSTVAGMFQSHQVTVIDADQIARDVVAPGSEALKRITEHFGDTLLDAEGGLDRAGLRRIIFQNPEEKGWLEKLLHPRIHTEALQRIQASNGPYCIYMAPLLIENRLFAMVDRILVVDLPVDLQVSRAGSRDGQSGEEIKKIITSQVSREQRLKYADDVIDNSVSLEVVHQQVKALHLQYVKMAHARQSKKI